jgi:general secretion pathway protein G
MKINNLFNNRLLNNRSGFTLIELLVVIVIIGMLAALVGPKLFGKVGTSKQKAAEAQIQLFGQALDMMRLDIGRYPTTSEGLEALINDPGIEGWEGPYLKKNIVPQDPWKRDYVYQSPGSNGDYDLSSYGLDGNVGGDDENKDINSWE